MANKRQGKFFSFLQNNLVSVAIVLVVFLLFIKIPKFLIDINMILNLAFSIVILMVVINIPRPSDFQTFPRIVLIQTLFSLAINISSTRLILTGTLQNGKLTDQSDMVTAFAELVAGNDLVVGFVIFIIIIVVQVLVVTKGSGRVSEVAARFSLDSMNNKFFDITDRFNSGAIDEADYKKSQETYQNAQDDVQKYLEFQQDTKQLQAEITKQQERLTKLQEKEEKQINKLNKKIDKGIKKNIKSNEGIDPNNGMNIRERYLQNNIERRNDKNASRIAQRDAIAANHV